MIHEKVEQISAKQALVFHGNGIKMPCFGSNTQHY